MIVPLAVAPGRPYSENVAWGNIAVVGTANTTVIFWGRSHA